jgi:hypothetical protein
MISSVNANPALPQPIAREKCMPDERSRRCFPEPAGGVEREIARLLFGRPAALGEEQPVDVGRVAQKAGLFRAFVFSGPGGIRSAASRASVASASRSRFGGE